MQAAPSQGEQESSYALKDGVLWLCHLTFHQHKQCSDAKSFSSDSVGAEAEMHHMLCHE